VDEKATIEAQKTSVDATTSTLRAEHTALETKFNKLELEMRKVESEKAVILERAEDLQRRLARIDSGTEILVPTGELEPATLPSGQSAITASPVAMQRTVTLDARQIKTSTDDVEVLALGNSCWQPGPKPEGCANTAATNVTCDVPDQVMHAICSYKTIEVPADLNDVPLTYSVLDPGSKVRLQLVKAFDHFMVGSQLLLQNTPVVLDRTLIPLKKIYDDDALKGVHMAGALTCSNVQYSRFLDAQSGRACRQVFDVLYGSTNASLDASKLASIGLTLARNMDGATVYKVTAGPFAQIYSKPINSIVHPQQLFVHPKWFANVSSEYRHGAQGYSVPSSSAAGASNIEEGNKRMVLAIRHLANAAATYLYETAYDEKTVKIPGADKIPAGAFAMLPRPDINAILATTILFPRALTSSSAPAFADAISEFAKDDKWSQGSRICAVGAIVLNNYAFESVVTTGEMYLSAKTNPENASAVFAEAARRVAEITRLAEAIRH
jgi:hypothetical protein